MSISQPCFASRISSDCLKSSFHVVTGSWVVVTVLPAGSSELRNLHQTFELPRDPLVIGLFLRQR